jgi:hypothetical protein
LRKLVSSGPSLATASRRVGSSTSGQPWSATARMMVAQPTPRSRAIAATAWASVPTRRQASAWARSVSTTRGRIAAVCSVQVRALQAGSRQRQIRLRQANTTDRPLMAVADPDRAAAVELGPHPAADAADQGGGGLDLELPFTGRDLRGVDLPAVQAQQPGGRGTMVLTHLGPPCRRHASASYARSQVLFWRLLRHPQQGTTPRFVTKSHFFRPVDTGRAAYWVSIARPGGPTPFGHRPASGEPHKQQRARWQSQGPSWSPLR